MSSVNDSNCVTNGELRFCKTASSTYRHLIEEVNRSTMEKQTGGKGATGGLDG